MEKNQFRLADVILSVICVVFVAEAAAPVASIGNSQYFWWIFMILAFLLPYGLIAAELGTAYAGDGGLYDWIHAAYPNGKWAARASWYYWINFPLWMASLAVMCPELITFITGRSLGTFGSLIVELLFIWIVTLIACYPVCDSIIILNVSAVIKIVLALLVGGLGVWYISRYGFVNDMSARTFLPSFDLNSLSYISVIIFNFLGFEVVCTYANNMSDPKKQIPQSIVTGGIVIAAIYLFSAFGIGAAVDVREISVDSGLIDAVACLVKLGLVNKRGRLQTDALFEGERAVPLSGNVWLTQNDLRQFQLAKGAIAAGIWLLLRQLGIGTEAVDRLLLAGAFGSFIRPESACTVGLLPAELLAKTSPIGNAAGSGARLMAESADLFAHSEQVARETEVLELGSCPDFQLEFAKGMWL